MHNSDQPVKWHALQVKPRSEKKVGLRLSEMGFEVCVPTQKQLRYWSDRKKMIDVVLFNNYVFVATDTKRRNEVFQVGNILKYVQFGGRVAALSAQEVVMIKGLSQVRDAVQITYERFSPGEEVEVISGSLCGLRGTITAVNGASRIQLALPSLHCFANVEIQGLDVRKVINNKVVN